MARQEFIDTSKDILLKNFEILTSSIDDAERRIARETCVQTINKCYTELGHWIGTLDAVQTNENAVKTDFIVEVKEDTAISENVQNEALNASEEDVTSDNVDVQTQESEDEPKYAVFYSLNHASYLALDETLHCCTLVRNLAKAYCVGADVNSIANGQNELSRHNLEKFKPLQIRFLTQKEYDDTIGRAKSMVDLIANLPTVENTEISSEHTVANFATNTKNAVVRNHRTISGNTYANYGSSVKHDKPKGFDWFNRKPYGQSDQKTNGVPTNVKKISVTDKLENPRMLYMALHSRIDKFEPGMMPLMSSYENDIPNVNSIHLDTIDDFNELIPLLNMVLTKISVTKSSWLLEDFERSFKMRGISDIDNDYLMDIDYSVLDDAISEWNAHKRPEKSGHLMYVEDFDPTIAAFKRNIKNAAKKYNWDERELAAMAIYNYVRCLIAYEEYVCKTVGCNS